jgi:hypothetical protein
MTINCSARNVVIRLLDMNLKMQSIVLCVGRSLTRRELDMGYGQEMSDDDYFGYFGEEDDQEALANAIRVRIEDHLWIDKYGHALKVEDMRTPHIWNCIRFLNSQKKPRLRLSIFTEDPARDLIEEYIAMLKQELKRREE